MTRIIPLCVALILSACADPNAELGAVVFGADSTGVNVNDTDVPVDNDKDDDGYDNRESGGDDCNDDDPSINPGATEVCDDVDNDCDGQIDEDDVCGNNVDNDADNDGYDNIPSGGDDCDDNDANIHPGATDVCENGIDEDCSGADAVCNPDDNDGDGYDENEDCNDNDPSINPGMAELTCDGIDNDCDGSTLDNPDTDGDGYGVCDGDCDTGDGNIHPGATDHCENGIDEDCSGSDSVCAPVDADGDGYDENVDCNDGDASINPGATEVMCDGVDNDCSGATPDDEDLDSDGSSVCDGDCNDSSAVVYPTASEVCDSVDNDCDGLIDDEDPGATGLGAWYPDDDGDGYGDEDAAAEYACSQPTDTVSDHTDCDDSDNLRNPAQSEVLDIRDNDCDGWQDEDGRVTVDRYFYDHGNVVADIDGDGSNETYWDWEHRYSASALGGWTADGYGFELYPTDICTGSYAPLDGCVENSDGTVDLWGGAYALVALSSCEGEFSSSGLHVSLLLQEDTVEFADYDADPDFACTRLGYAFAWSGAAMNDMADVDGDGDGGVSIYRHASSPFYGEPETESGSPGDVMYDLDSVSADASYTYSTVWFVVLDAWD